ncbi:MAG: DUF4349 domain-containing protein [Nanoarchaeota archaeon]|nr:DUF4349 domain-containing protein [Nanoarchaeota archaeon]
MSFKKQLILIKENWLIIALIIGALIIPNLGAPMYMLNNGISAISQKSYSGYGMAEMAYDSSYSGSMPPIYDNRNFAPDELERKIVKTSSLSTETRKGEFKAQEEKLKNIVSSSESLMINENVNKYGEESKAYYYGYYTIKVPVTKYPMVLDQLKTLGEVKSFNENSDDITGSYSNAEIELETEKERLKRYESMFAQAEKMEDKINLNDRMFDQERKIKYLEDMIKNMDETVDYSTISFSMTEKQSEYADIALAKLSHLVRNLVGSFNGLLNLIFVLLPWAVFGGIIVTIVKIVKKKK